MTAPPPSPPRRDDDPTWQRRLRIAIGCAAFGLVLRHGGFLLPVPVTTLGLGVGLGGASFVLAWAGEAAETDLSSGLVLALVAFIVVLPELVIEVHFAYTQQNAYATANLGGAIRLLLTCAVGMPLVAAWFLRHRHAQPLSAAIRLDPSHRLELGLLLVASAFGMVIAASGRVTALDGLLLGGMYFMYLRGVNRSATEPPELFGVSRGLASLPAGDRRPWIASLLIFAALVVIDVADPFAESLLRTGTRAGIDPFLLIQSVVPVVTEMPELVVASVLVIHQRPGRAVALLIASPVSQWTLAIAAIAAAHTAGGGGALPLDPREQVELMLTAATTAMAVAALVTLEAERIDARIILVLYAVQFAFPSLVVRAGVAIVLATLAVDLLVARRRAVRELAEAVRPRPRPAARAGPGEGPA